MFLPGALAPARPPPVLTPTPPPGEPRDETLFRRESRLRPWRHGLQLLLEDLRVLPDVFLHGCIWHRTRRRRHDVRGRPDFGCGCGSRHGSHRRPDQHALGKIPPVSALVRRTKRCCCCSDIHDTRSWRHWQAGLCLRNLHVHDARIHGDQHPVFRPHGGHDRGLARADQLVVVSLRRSLHRRPRRGLVY